MWHVGAMGKQEHCGCFWDGATAVFMLLGLEEPTHHAAVNNQIFVCFGDRCMQMFYTGHLSLGEFLTSRRLWPFIRQCDSGFLSEFCANAVWHMFYGPSSQATADDLEMIRNTWPATVAARTISHWAQVCEGAGTGFGGVES